MNQLNVIEHYQWDLSHDEAGWSEGKFQHAEFNPQAGIDQIMTVETSLVGFQPLAENARRCGAWIGITTADFIDLSGRRQTIDADLKDPASWPRQIACKGLRHYTITAYVLRCNASVTWKSWVWS